MSRDSLIRPYRDEHRASIDARERRREPRSLPELLSWFIEGWQDETRIPLHERGVWHDGEASSALGAPQWSAPAKKLLTGSPFATDYDPRIDSWTAGSARVWPIRAALEAMKRHNPFMARFLHRVALAGGAWAEVDTNVPVEYREVYVAEALRRLYRAWENDERHILAA